MLILLGVILAIILSINHINYMNHLIENQQNEGMANELSEKTKGNYENAGIVVEEMLKICKKGFLQGVWMAKEEYRQMVNDDPGS